MWDLIVSVPDHCLPFYFTGDTSERQSFTRNDNHATGRVVSTNKEDIYI